MKYKIIKIREDFLHKLRAEGLDDLNQKVVRLIAQGGEPCRDVLRRARAGEELILASYCPFKQNGPYKEYGPIFVLAKESCENINYFELPISIHMNSQKKHDYLQKSFVIRAYNKKEEIIDAQVVSEEESQTILLQFLNNEKTDFVMARFTAYGCYSLRLERHTD
ncbi:MAG: DUF1203 domain-containing protein [Campylobacteraceae bacterium]|nr:DUF1203 domain-containing protein [Campylobacteraceae bacterium]